uniref:DUF4105 domain-containing protein n=1 Tax=Fundidesulfovibrio putealis TaxID=270496 RepID=A0A7C4EIT5_9BACT
MIRLAAAAGKSLLAVAIALATCWAALAAYWAPVSGQAWRLALAVGVVLATVLVFVLIRRKRLALLVWLTGFAAFAAWWAALEPSGQRDWQPDVAVPPYAQVDGGRVTVHNVRSCLYRTETDYDVRHQDRTYDLAALESVDLIAVYWMGDAIAHVMTSFGFAGGDTLCISIETRKARGQEYSSLKGFFKQYELIYVAADERDLIGLRARYRQPPEDVYVYRLRLPVEDARKLFLEYIREMNSLRARPQFYNTLTTNCTTNVVRHFRAFGGKVRYTWKILLSGYAPQYAYELGALDDSMPFAQLRARSLVNAKALAAGDAPDFSRRIRQGLPGIGQGGVAP